MTEETRRSIDEIRKRLEQLISPERLLTVDEAKHVSQAVYHLALTLDDEVSQPSSNSMVN